MEQSSNEVINTSAKALETVTCLRDLDHEEVWLLYLSAGCRFLGSEMVSKGTLTHTSIDNRTILRRALLCNAVGIIILHNHPSGDPSPSSADIKFTRSLHRACSLIGVNLLDHIIVSDKSFFSFADEKENEFLK